MSQNMNTPSKADSGAEKPTIIKIGPEDSVSVNTHYGDHGERTYKEIIILSGHDKMKHGKNEVTV